MYNSSKIKTLESLFPIYAVERGCIISKDADVTVAFAVELPELFTVTEEEYEAIHDLWYKAVKLLPAHTVVHKQDWYLVDKVESDFDGELSFLDRSFKRHFNERPYLSHHTYLYITKSTKKKMMQKSILTTLCRSTLVPKEVRDKEGLQLFLDAVAQFERIINDSPRLKVRRLTEDEIVGTAEKGGIYDEYFTLSNKGPVNLEDISLRADTMRIGDNYLCVHTLSELDVLPEVVSESCRYDKLSTDRSECSLSFASPVGLGLSCNHIYNQYIFIEDGDEILNNLEKKARNLFSLGRYSRANLVNHDWLQEYLNTAHSGGHKPVRAHFNVMAWSDNLEELKRIKNEVGSALSAMDCVPRHNTIDVPTLYWSGIAGNGGDFPWEESYLTFIRPVLCFFTQETNYRSSLSPFGIKVVDRLSGFPIHLDISDLPAKKGITTNRNKFILGPSGSGKSFFTNHLVRQYYEQGSHIVLVDTGNSYEGLCSLINAQTKGKDGIYYTYTDEKPISFNPFYTDDKVFDVEKRDSIVTLLFTLWKNPTEGMKKTEEAELRTVVNEYIERIQSGEEQTPCFDGFYEYVRDVYRPSLKEREIPVTEKEFDVGNFLTAVKLYYKGGVFDFLLNSKKNIDLKGKRFVVFEIDTIKDNKALFPIVTIIIMESFINKMRHLKGIRKLILIEEAWKAIASANMADYIKYLYKTVRKFFGEAIVVTQEVDDIIHSPIVKESIINNSDCKILLDQRKYMNKFDSIQEVLGLTDKERNQILSINMNNDTSRLYKEVWIGLGGTQSAVYGVEVSMEEYLAYTTEEREKLEVQNRAKELGGNVELAIRQLAQEKRERNSNH